MTTIGKNQIQSFSTSVTGLINPNTTQESRVNSVQKIATEALKIAFDAISDAQEEARTNVDNNQKKNNDLQTATETQANANKNAIDEKVNEIKQNQEKIQ